MNRFLVLFLLLLAAACNSKPAMEDVTAAERVKVGAPAPDFTLTSTAGQTVSLKDYKGKVVLLDFWATWCPPCRMSTPALVKLNEKFKDKNAAVLGISLDEDVKEVVPYLEKAKVSHTVLYGGDSSVGQAYRVRAIPMFFLLDASGTVVKSYTGYDDSYPEEWEKEIRLLLDKKGP